MLYCLLAMPPNTSALPLTLTEGEISLVVVKLMGTTTHEAATLSAISWQWEIANRIWSQSAEWLRNWAFSGVRGVILIGGRHWSSLIRRSVLGHRIVLQLRRHARARRKIGTRTTTTHRTDLSIKPGWRGTWRRTEVA